MYFAAFYPIFSKVTTTGVFFKRNSNFILRYYTKLSLKYVNKIGRNAPSSSQDCPYWINDKPMAYIPFVNVSFYIKIPTSLQKCKHSKSFCKVCKVLWRILGNKLIQQWNKFYIIQKLMLSSVGSIIPLKTYYYTF